MSLVCSQDRSPRQHHAYNRQANPDDHPNFADGPLDDKELDRIIRQVMQPKYAPSSDSHHGLVFDPRSPLVTARAFVTMSYYTDDGPTLWQYRDDFYAWTGLRSWRATASSVIVFSTRLTI